MSKPGYHKIQKQQIHQRSEDNNKSYFHFLFSYFISYIICMQFSLMSIQTNNAHLILFQQMYSKFPRKKKKRVLWR